MWRRRQRELGIDDFGNPLNSAPSQPEDPLLQESPVPVTRYPSGGVPVQQAVDVAVQDDIREENSPERSPVRPHEETPLLKKSDANEINRTWFSWLIPNRR
jgi:hypothetical protein